VAKRSTMVKAAAAAGVAGAAILAGATPAMADTPGASLSATPSTNLLDGQPVDVTFATGLTLGAVPGPPSNVPLYVCKQATYDPAPDKCSPTGTLKMFVAVGLGPDTPIVYGGVSTPSDPVYNRPQVRVEKSWTWVKGTPPNLIFGTTTCTNQCYLVAQGPGIGTAPSVASKHVVFGAPK